MKSKIFFLNRFFFPDHSATSQLLTDLTFHLAKLGHEVTVITSRQLYDRKNANLGPSEVINGVRVYRIWTTNFGRYNLVGRALDYVTFYLVSAYRLFSLLKRNDIVVAKTDPPLISVFASMVAYFRGAKQINWIQDLFPEIALALKVKGLNRWGFELLRRLRNISLHTARTNVVLSSEMAKHLHKEKIPSDHIRIVHNWADNQKLSVSDEQSTELRQAWNLENKFVVGYSGNLGRAHEFGTVLDAAELLLTQKNIVFLLIGGGVQYDWLTSQKKKRGLNNVLFKPYQPQVTLGKSLRVPDVHVISLRPILEGYVVPSKFYSIAAVGRPVIYIGDACGEIARILLDANCGFVVSTGKGKILAETIKNMAKDKNSCLNMGENARKISSQRFEKKLALSNWSSILEL